MMQTMARVSAFLIVGLVVMNVVLGVVQRLMPHRAGQGEAQVAVLSGSPTLGRGVIDIGQALSTPVKSFADRILLEVEVTRVARTRKDVRLDLVVTPRAVDGYTPLFMDRLAVDATKTAIVTADGTWLSVRDAHGVGLLAANELLRRSPVYVIGAPRQVGLIFPPLSSPVSRVVLLVPWAPGRAALDADGWRTDRIVEVDLPPSP